MLTRMRTLAKWASIAVAAVLLLGIGAAIGQSGTEPAPPAAATRAASTPTAEPRPEIASDLTCDYVLGDSGQSGDPSEGYRFVGGGTVTNTGTAPARVRVTFRWNQLGTRAITVSKTYSVTAGQERDVQATVPATQDQIDLHQSADGECSAKTA